MSESNIQKEVRLELAIKKANDKISKLTQELKEQRIATVKKTLDELGYTEVSVIFLREVEKDK